MVKHLVEPENANFLVDLVKIQGYELIHDKSDGKIRILFYSNGHGDPIKADVVAFVEIGNVEALIAFREEIDKHIKGVERGIIDI